MHKLLAWNLLSCLTTEQRLEQIALICWVLHVPPHVPDTYIGKSKRDGVVSRYGRRSLHATASSCLKYGLSDESVSESTLKFSLNTFCSV